MDAVIAGWVRTPFHRAHKGSLAGVRPDTMVAECIKEVVKRLELDPAEVDDVIVGCAYPEGEQGYNIGSCLLYTSPSPRDATLSRMPSSA